jgi:hypothetical protein
MSLFYLPQYKTVRLDVAGGINDSTTSGIKIEDVTGIDTTKPGIIAVSYTTPLDLDRVEFITYTSIDGSNNLVGATRGAEGIVAKSHADKATIAFIISKSHINNINTAILAEHNASGTHSDITADSLSIDVVSEKTGANGVTVDGLNIKDGALNTAAAVSALSMISGGILQVVLSNSLGEITGTNIDTETYWGQLAITPKRSDSIIYVILFANGLDNNTAGRLYVRMRHETVSGGVTGTELCASQVASSGTGTTGVLSATPINKVLPGDTTLRYFKATVTKLDSSTQWWAGRYGTESRILLVEVRA